MIFLLPIRQAQGKLFFHQGKNDDQEKIKL